MNTRTQSRWFLLALVLACIATGLWLTRIRASTRITENALHRLAAENEHRASEIKTLRENLIHVPARESRFSPLSLEEQVQQELHTLITKLKHARLTAPPPPPRNPSGPGGEHFPELMSDPEYERLATRLWRSGTRSRWLHAFRYASIPHAKEPQLRALLLEFGFSGADASRTAQLAGASEEQSWKARMQAHDEVANEITALIGAEAYAKIQRAQRAQGADELVERLETRLSYSASPLNSSQAAQLFQLGVAQNLDRMVTDSKTFPALIEKARPFLNQDQLNALHEIASEFNGGKGRSGVTSSSPTP